MQDEGVCTYLVRAEVHLVHCSSRNHDLWQRGAFGSTVNFQISNGDNELPASIYRLFGFFLASFCHPFGPFYQFLYTKNHFEWFRSYMEGIWLGIGTFFIKFQKIKNIYIRSVHNFYFFFKKSTWAYRVGFHPHCCISLPFCSYDIGSIPSSCDTEPSYLL